MLKVTADLADADVKGIHTDNLVGLTFGKDYYCPRRKATVTIAGNLILTSPYLSQNRLGHLSVMAVAWLTGRFTQKSVLLTFRGCVKTKKTTPIDYRL